MLSYSAISTAWKNDLRLREGEEKVNRLPKVTQQINGREGTGPKSAHVPS